jgi:sugar-phosphatase
MDEATYATTVGLRTREFIEHWFQVYGIGMEHAEASDRDITERVIRKVREKGALMPGVWDAIELLKARGLKLGLATSSPMELVDAVLERTGLTGRFSALHSAEHLLYGKPHPQVYLDCAASLGSHPTRCVCFEDSFNGMIAAKAARMKCVVVPHPDFIERPVWQTADLKLASLRDLTSVHLSSL